MIATSSDSSIAGDETVSEIMFRPYSRMQIQQIVRRMLLNEVQRYTESLFSQCEGPASTRVDLDAACSAAVREATQARLARVLDDPAHFANILRYSTYVPSVADLVRTVYHRIYGQSLQQSVSRIVTAFRSNPDRWGPSDYQAADHAVTTLAVKFALSLPCPGICLLPPAGGGATEGAAAASLSNDWRE